jgi:hypothetical protein
MKLRQKSKRDQALDAVASIAKTWSEWRLGEKVSTTASKASKKASKGAGKASKKAKKQAGKGSAAGAAKRTRVKIVGVVALGGIGAAVAKKLAGGKAEPLYTPTGSAPDTPPPPSPVAVEHAQDAPSSEPTAVPASDEPALTAPKDVPPRDPSPVVVGDLASDAPAGGEEPGSEDVEAAPLAEDHPPSTDDAPDPENLISETADEPDAGAPPDKAT